MAIKCPSCGGFMHYDIQNKNLKCVYCDTTQSIADYTGTQEAKRDEDAEQFENEIEYSIYECPDCGAQTRVLEEQATLFCPYCGRQSFYRGNERSEKPVRIIPFEVDKSQVKDIVSSKIRSKFFTPKTYRGDEEGNEFRGIYIPYWSYNAEFTIGDSVHLEGKYSYSIGNTDYEETYAFTATLDEVEDIAFDASDTFEDNIATAISPFKSDRSMEFSEAYAAGFYIDRDTTPKEKYMGRGGLVQRETERHIESELMHQLKHNGVEMDSVDVKDGADSARQSANLNYFPVWFNTKRFKDRVLYSVINGQTGKAYMDLPVDKKKFLLGWLILGVPLTVVCYLLFTTALGMVSAGTISLVSIGFHAVFMAMLLLESYKIKKNDSYVYSADGSKPRKSVFTYIPGNIILTLISLAAMIVSIVLIVKARSRDSWFYIATCLNFAGMGLISFGCIRGFDYLSSRPAPNFFTREGGNNNEENN